MTKTLSPIINSLLTMCLCASVTLYFLSPHYTRGAYSDRRSQLEPKIKRSKVREVRLGREVVFSGGHAAFPFSRQRDRVSSTSLDLCLSPSRSDKPVQDSVINYLSRQWNAKAWRNIPPGEKRSLSSCTWVQHTHTTVMNGNNISIGTSGRQSFHADVLIASKSKGRAKKRGEIFRRALKKLWFLNPSVCQRW